MYFTTIKQQHIFPGPTPDLLNEPLRGQGLGNIIAVAIYQGLNNVNQAFCLSVLYRVHKYLIWT